jgi:hypothetical protein
MAAPRPRRAVRRFPRAAVARRGAQLRVRGARSLAPSPRALTPSASVASPHTTDKGKAKAKPEEEEPEEEEDEEEDEEEAVRCTRARVRGPPLRRAAAALHAARAHVHARKRA